MLATYYKSAQSSRTLTGAWIETYVFVIHIEVLMVAPSRVRGLKQRYN